MGSITTWRRLEPRTRSPHLPAIAARVADPLWLVARQWQAGELTGSDTATPLAVTVTYDSAPLSMWAPVTGTTPPDPRLLPAGHAIDWHVEIIPATLSLTDRAAAGRHFLRLLGDDLADRYGTGFRTEYALPDLTAAEADQCDDAGLRRAALLTRRAIDGERLRAIIGSPDAPVLPQPPQIDAADEQAVKQAATDYTRWWDRQFPQTKGAWTAQRLASPFQTRATTARGAVVLVALEHRGGRVGWHTFDVAAIDPTDTHASTPQAFTSLATEMSYPGMPATRWWQFENAAVDLGRLDAAPDDLARLLLAEFALIYGNDFYVVPLTVRSGSVTRIVHITVTTTFGETFNVPSTITSDALAGVPRWRMFHNDSGRPDTGDGDDLLVMAPSALGILESSATESVLFARDEMANLAWAIERSVRSPVGTTLERREVEHARNRRRHAEPTVTNEARYRLSTTMPDSWLALQPVVGTGFLEQQGPIEPVGTLLNNVPFRLDMPELPRTGRSLTAHVRRARAADGTVAIWRAWRVAPGRGESSSGLRHDDLTHEQG